MDEYLGMRSISAPNSGYIEERSGELDAESMSITESALNATIGRPESDLGYSILQSLLYWERIFAYQEGGKPRGTNGDTECVEKAEPGLRDEPISE